MAVEPECHLLLLPQVLLQHRDGSGLPCRRCGSDQRLVVADLEMLERVGRDGVLQDFVREQAADGGLDVAGDPADGLPHRRGAGTQALQQLLEAPLLAVGLLDVLLQAGPKIGKALDPGRQALEVVERADLHRVRIAQPLDEVLTG